MQVARQYGKAPAQLALAWVMGNPIVTSPIVGATNVAQIRETLQAQDIELTESDLLLRSFPAADLYRPGA